MGSASSFEMVVSFFRRFASYFSHLIQPIRWVLAFLITLMVIGASCVWAQGSHPEDLPIPDAPIIAQPAKGTSPSVTKAKATTKTNTSASAVDVPPLEDEPPVAIPGGTGADVPMPDVDAAPSQSGGLFDVASSFRPPFMREALLAGVAVALLCSYLGVYVVLRRVAFVGVALAEASTAGIALAILLGFSPLLGGLALMMVAVGTFSVQFAPRRLPNETAVGVVYVLAGALAILLLSKSAQGEGHLLSLLQGDVLTVEPGETVQMVVAFVLIAVLHAFFGRTWTLVSFDREAAATMGYTVGAWELGLLLTVGVAVAFASRAVGSLMTTGMLLLPAATALLWRDRMRAVFIVAPILGLIAVVLGLHLSFVIDVPASAVTVTIAFAFFLVALVARRLGVQRT